MKIKKLEYYDEEYQWQLEAVEFSPNFNLLVGVSGAGKTRILQAIYSLKAIANGESLNGVKWSISFSAKNNMDYYWSGEFETKDSSNPIDSESNQEENVKIIHETLIFNNTFVIKRNKDEIIFNGEKTPKLSPFESVIELLKQEDIISPIQEELDRIILTDSEQSFDSIWRLPISLFKKYEKSSLLTIKESDLPIPVKLAILYRVLPNEFEKIKQAFISIFNRVLDVQIGPLKDEEVPMNLSDFLKEAMIVRIKEKGVETWIKNISSGMFKTLMYISELYLSPDDCVILIDEFENSLGVNSIDSVTELIVNHKKSQFIITSHHPYIINNISPVYWKIVTRQGGLVTVKTAKDFHISESRRKAFIDLINVLEDEDEDSED